MAFHTGRAGFLYGDIVFDAISAITLLSFRRTIATIGRQWLQARFAFSTRFL